YKNGPDYDFDVAGFQTGLDLFRRQADGGARDVAGLYVGAGRITGDVDAVYGGKAGSVSMYGYSLGGYWTRKGAGGWYV
ncbi:autotransporter domain-containing protein, partial [Streptomyces niveiscabiei]